MAEFCLECWNKINETDGPEIKYIISKDLDLCEGCGRQTNVIVTERKDRYLHKPWFIMLSFKIIYNVLFIL